MRELIIRLNNLMEVLEEAEGKAEELEIAKVRMPYLYRLDKYKRSVFK